MATEKISGAEALIKSLIAEKTEYIFGYPGGAIMPVFDVLYDYRDKLKHILVRHEQGATHAAQGYARVSGKTGVVMVTSGPAATNIITGLSDAMMDSTPLIVITGQVASPLLGSDAFQETDVVDQISIIFTRRQLNIESLSVSGSAIEGVHKFTITTYSDRETMEKLVKQIEKRIDVLRAFFYTDDEIIFQEVALYKVPTDKLLDDRSIEDLIRKHNARILEVNRTYTVIEKSGHPNETQSLFEELSRYDVMQFVRSGRVAITKSTVEHVSIFLQEQQCRQNQL